jgi:hypothetical protein
MATSATAQQQMAEFKRYVPTRFLSPWFSETLRPTKDSQRDTLIARLAKESQTTQVPSLYWLDGDQVRLNSAWHGFLKENYGVVLAFAEYHLARYLQTRNPNVPGIINKLRAPTQRELAAARSFWRFVHHDLERAGERSLFTDIYAGVRLGDDFSIDHFLPWSFVAHDLLWNLAPVEKITNSKKGDALPDLKTYLPKLAKLHFRAIQAAIARPKQLEDHTNCFRIDAPGLVALGEQGLLARYREVVEPQAQIAINQGFRPAWVYSN